MRRLITKAESDIYEIFDFLGQWLTNWETIESSQISKILEENPDCVYNGVGYRTLELMNNSVARKITNWEDGFASKAVAEAAVKETIWDLDSYQSFSKSEAGILEFASDYEPSDFETHWVIKSNISGLDLQKLYLKYKDQMKAGALNAFERYEEVLSILSDFSVEGPIINGVILSDYKIDESTKQVTE